MDIVTDVKQKNKRYLPHELTTRINSVKLYRQTRDLDFVLRRYRISKASLMHWNKRYDGTKESLMDQSHRPHNHPNQHTEGKIKLIKDMHRRAGLERGNRGDMQPLPRNRARNGRWVA